MESRRGFFRGSTAPLGPLGFMFLDFTIAARRPKIGGAGSGSQKMAAVSSENIDLNKWLKGCW